MSLESMQADRLASGAFGARRRCLRQREKSPTAELISFVRINPASKAHPTAFSAVHAAVIAG
jgi:hypothetical protein